MMKSTLIIMTGLIGLVCTNSAQSSLQDEIPSTESQLVQELREKIPNARIELDGSLRVTSGLPPKPENKIRLHHENGNGTAAFQWSGGAGEISYSAIIRAPVAIKRVFPGERFHDQNITIQEIDVSRGILYQSRGLILSSEADLTGLQARQSIIEGQPALTSGVQRIPDILRGQGVQVRMISGMVSVMATGIADEPASLNDSVRVTLTKGKKRVTGRLLQAGIVEVSL